MGVPLGQEVGYQVRFDRKCTEATRIVFVTDGILLRRLLNDPELAGVSAVIFDEFHERNLESDLLLALLHELSGSSRPDLRLLVMSATLDAKEFEKRMGDSCRVLHSEGRCFPVDVRYLERSPNPASSPVWTLAARSCSDLLREQDSGHILVFMPGRSEIRKTLEACRAEGLHKHAALEELHGDLSLEQQARVLRSEEKRKIIVTTNIAESSLTVDNVVAVVDSGLVRMARFDADRSMDTLHIQAISQASADQRTGRAGRTRPGACMRLWTESNHRARPISSLPEIHRCDLSVPFLHICWHTALRLGRVSLV